MQVTLEALREVYLHTGQQDAEAWKQAFEAERPQDCNLCWSLVSLEPASKDLDPAGLVQGVIDLAKAESLASRNRRRVPPSTWPF